MSERPHPGRKTYVVVASRDRRRSDSTARSAAQAAMSSLDAGSGPVSSSMSASGGSSQYRSTDFESGITATLQTLQQQVVHGLQEIGSNLPQVIRDIVKDEIQRAQSGPPQVAPRMNLDTRQLDDLNTKIKVLEAKNQSLEEHQGIQETKIKSLNFDLNKKSRESRKLHEIIIQSGQEEPVISDENVVKEFGALSYGIMRIVKKQFAFTGATGAKPKWRQLNNMTLDDRELFLRAYIADRMYAELFHPSARLFGLDAEREKHQVELENKLLARQVTEADIIEWRVQTVKVAKLLNLTKRLHRPDRLSKSLCEDLKEIRLAPDFEAWNHAKDDMEDLCEKAFNLALALRACKTKIEWSQGAAPASLPGADIELIGPFNVTNNLAPVRPVRVLFGTVYKIVGGDPIVLRKGDVLNGCE